jgi:hypothetical protein
MAGLHLDIELLPESLGRASYQITDIVDKLADQKRDASRSIRHMLTAFEDGDPQVRIPPARLRGRAHAGAVAADHNKSLMRHPDCLLFGWEVV